MVLLIHHNFTFRLEPIAFDQHVSTTRPTPGPQLLLCHQSGLFLGVEQDDVAYAELAVNEPPGWRDNRRFAFRSLTQVTFTSVGQTAYCRPVQQRNGHPSGHDQYVNRA